VANSNFVVHNGLTVGGLVIDAATANLTTSGSLNVTTDINILGNLYVQGSMFDSNVKGATIDDATALAIALGG
jgi:hypothetical protein